MLSTTTIYKDMFYAQLKTLVDKWSDPDFWKDEGSRMDSADCAIELRQLLHPPTIGTDLGV